MFLLHMFLTSSAVLETNISEGVIHLQYLHSHALYLQYPLLLAHASVLTSH